MAVAQIGIINQEVSYALWRIEESLETLQEYYSFSDEDHEILNAHKIVSRKMEWLSARLALNSLMKEMGMADRPIFKDEFGKPHIAGENVFISISHTKGWGAAVLSLAGPVGIDIEFPKPQVLRIARKFLHTDEYGWTNNDMHKLTQVWSAKEALYKLHGRTRLIFAKQLLVKEPKGKYPEAGLIIENNSQTNYQLSYDQTDDLIICIAH